MRATALCLAVTLVLGSTAAVLVGELDALLKQTQTREMNMDRAMLAIRTNLPR